MELLLQRRLCALRAGANRLRVKAGEGARRVRVVEDGPSVVPPGDEQRHAKGPRHRGLALVVALTKVEREVADGLRQRLDGHRLVEGETVVLRLRPRVVDQGARVGRRCASRP